MGLSQQCQTVRMRVAGSSIQNSLVHKLFCFSMGGCYYLIPHQSKAISATQLRAFSEEMHRY